MFAAVELIQGGFKRFNRTTSSPRRPHIDRPTTSRAVKLAWLPLRGMAHACTQAPKPSHYSTLPSRAYEMISHSLESLSVGLNQFACSICNLAASASTSSLSICDRNRTSTKSRIRQHPMLTTLSTQKASSFSPKHSRNTTSLRRIAHESRAVCRAKY